MRACLPEFCFLFTTFALCAEDLQNRNQNILIDHTKYKKWQNLPEENWIYETFKCVAKAPNIDVFSIFSARPDFEWTFYFLVSDSEFPLLLLSNKGKSCQVGENFILRWKAWNKHSEDNCTPAFKSKKASQICYAFENLAKECYFKGPIAHNIIPRALCSLPNWASTHLHRHDTSWLMHKRQHGAQYQFVCGGLSPPLKTIIVPKIQSIIFVGLTALSNIRLLKCHDKTFTEL